MQNLKLVTTDTKGLVIGFIAVVVGVALVPVVASLVASANVTGTTSTIVSLIPTFFGLAVLLSAVKSALAETSF